jgi:hypothetical protein
MTAIKLKLPAENFREKFREVFEVPPELDVPVTSGSVDFGGERGTLPCQIVTETTALQPAHFTVMGFPESSLAEFVVKPLQAWHVPKDLMQQDLDGTSPEVALASFAESMQGYDEKLSKAQFALEDTHFIISGLPLGTKPADIFPPEWASKIEMAPDTEKHAICIPNTLIASVFKAALAAAPATGDLKATTSSGLTFKPKTGKWAEEVKPDAAEPDAPAKSTLTVNIKTPIQKMVETFQKKFTSTYGPAQFDKVAIGDQDYLAIPMPKTVKVDLAALGFTKPEQFPRYPMMEWVIPKEQIATFFPSAASDSWGDLNSAMRTTSPYLSKAQLFLQPDGYHIKGIVLGTEPIHAFPDERAAQVAVLETNMEAICIPEKAIATNPLARNGAAK